MESISVNDLLWIQWKNHLISFNYLGMPKGLHYTIAFNENSQFINLHLTKNINTINNNKKPKIEICRIKKKDFDEIIPKITWYLLSYILVEVPDTNEFQNYYFIPYDEFEDEALKKGIKKGLIDNFKDITKLKQSKRLKIKGDINKKLSEYTENRVIIEKISEKIELFNNDKKTNGGILLLENESIGLFKIQDKWFKLNLKIDWKLVLKNYFGSELLNYFEKYITKSSKIIEQAKNYDDCKLFDNPVILGLSKEK